MKICAYARVSSEDQQERRTIENQIEYGIGYVELMFKGQVFDTDKIHKWYKDDGITGTLPLEQRPEGKELLEDAKAGNIDIILIFKLDRLGRSARIILNAVHELEQYGVKIRSMTEPFDTQDPNGRFLLTVLAGVADLERETILERMRLGANRAAREGKWLGGIVPYGYRIVEKRLEINDDPIEGFELSEAGIVRLIYRLTVEQKWSTISIANYLNVLGLPPSYVINSRQVKKGKRKVNTAGLWLPSRIRHIIVSTTYKGVHIFGKRSKKRDAIEREVPAIVSGGIWSQAQDVLRSNAIEAMRNTKRQYLLRGLIRCGLCGLVYCGAYYHSYKVEKGYYICNGKNKYYGYRGPYPNKCPSKNVPQLWIEDLVWEKCVSFMSNPEEALKELVASLDANTASETNVEAEMSLAVRTLNGKEDETQKIMDLYRRNLIAFSDLEIQLKKIQNETEALKWQIKLLEKKARKESNSRDQANNLMSLLSALNEKLSSNLDFEEKREIIKMLVKEIRVTTVDEDLEIRISYNGLDDIAAFAPQVIAAPFILYSGRRKQGDSPGARLRNARLAKKMTIRELAVAAHLSENTIGVLEADKFNATPTHLRALSSVLEVTVAHLGRFEDLPETTLGQRIIKARLFQGFTKYEMANAIGVDVATLRHWEQDKHKPLNRYLDLLQPYIVNYTTF